MEHDGGEVKRVSKFCSSSSVLAIIVGEHSYRESFGLRLGDFSRAKIQNRRKSRKDKIQNEGVLVQNLYIK